MRDQAIRHARLAYLLGGGSGVERLGYDEPETRAYLDDHVTGEGVFWDIGANIGEFALHCAARNDRVRIYAFEPVAENYAVLAERVRDGGLGDRVHALPLALAARNELTAITLSNLFAGSVRNVLDGRTDQYGNVPKAGRQAVLAIRPDDAVALFGVPRPDHIKLDVDGLEPEILGAAPDILRSVRSVLVEVKGRYAENAALIEAPLQAGGLAEDMAFRERWGGENRLFLRPA
ncbi:FkbM family methyltransferase [Roseomonas sp. AR75]|uniref:FkbM family methyltransferase n=1 Tax=Roseomonas sp. AR75 TaxID=2562311 RepID=UPI0014852368|nr:FkbM family methyltransferase [Roseomonas sp. AR75]